MRTNAERFGKLGGTWRMRTMRSKWPFGNRLPPWPRQILCSAGGRAVHKIVRAIWNGPFHIGPLSQPATVGDVLAKVLETLWRTLVFLVSLISAVCGIALGWAFIIQPVFFPFASTKLTTITLYDDGKQILPPIISLGTPPEYVKPQCVKDYPIKVFVTNNSRHRSISNVKLQIKAFEPYSSRDVARNTWYLSMDAIILPKGGWHWQCYNVSVDSRQDPTSMTYKAEILSADYQD